MAVIHDKRLFIKTSQLIKKGDTHYAFYNMKKQVYYTPIYLAYFIVLRFFGIIESNWIMFIFYSIFLLIIVFASYFNYKDSFLDLIYDYNETIDYYSIHDLGFFDGIIYKKYIVKFTKDSYNFSN